MRKIIDGKAYDSNAADVLHLYDNNLPYDDFKAERVSLHRTAKGTYFLHGEGGALTDWCRDIGNGGCTSGEDIRLLKEDEAMRWLEQHGDAEDFESVFGEAVEG